MRKIIFLWGLLTLWVSLAFLLSILILSWFIPSRQIVVDLNYFGEWQLEFLIFIPGFAPALYAIIKLGGRVLS